VSDFRRSELEGTMGKMQMQKLRKMLDEGSLESELREVMQDDIEDLYGAEVPKQEETIKTILDDDD
jgi:hypothetical protein